MEATSRWSLVTAIAPIAWGSAYYVTHAFLPAGAPFWGAALRALPAGLVLLGVTRMRPRGSWWWKSVVLGGLNVGGFFVLVYVAGALLPSSVASTLASTSAVVMLVLAWPFVGERPELLPSLGAVVGVSGVGVMVLDAQLGLDLRGVLAALAAVAMSSCGYLLSKRWGAADSGALASTAWQLVAGGLLVLPVALLVEGAPPALTPAGIAGFAYISLIATAIAFVAWFAGLARLPAGAVGLIGLLNPVTGVVLGVLLAHEVFGWSQAVGAVLVLAGVILGRPGRGPIRDVQSRRS